MNECAGSCGGVAPRYLEIDLGDEVVVGFRERHDGKIA